MGYELASEATAPPTFPAYSRSNENFSRVSSTDSVTEVYAQASTPPLAPPTRPTFMVPTPLQPMQPSSPAATMYASTTGHYEHAPVHHNVGYAAYEQRAPARSPYAGAQAPSVSYEAYAPYQASSTQNLEYAAYGEMQAQSTIKYTDAERSPHGRPAHVAISFGFGGSLILSGPGYAGGRTSHGTSIPPCSLRVHSVRALLADGNTLGVEYVRSLERLTGPLAGQRADNVLKMIDAVLSAEGDKCRDHEVLLWRMLAAMLRHKGALTLDGDLLGENRKSALAEISAIIAGENQGTSEGGWVSASLDASPLNPSGGSDERAIVEVEKLLISGQRGAALNLAIQAKLWPHAILLARHLGGKYYQETIAQMSRSVCRFGTPLHTLELLMAGLPQDLLSSPVGSAPNAQGLQTAGPSRVRELIPRWREHVGILCTNPTNGSEMLLKALGDELWMTQDDVAAAHVAYTLSREKPTVYSFNARVCLLNADHRRYPRTYATPTNINLTEILESALLGTNSQAQLPSLLPYKLLLAGALAEVGKLREALSYVEHILRSLRSLDRMSPEVDVALVGTLAAQMEHRLQDGLRGKSGKLAGVAVGAAKTLVSGFKGLLDRSVSSLFGDESDFQPQPGTLQGPPPGPGLYQQQQPPAQAPIHAQHMHSAPYQQQPQQYQPPQQQYLSQLQSPPQPPPPVIHKSSSSSGGGLLRSMSALFSGSAAAPEAAPQPQTDHNVFYYDETLKMWCERGKELINESPPLGAPPERSESPTSSVGSLPGPPPVMASAHNTTQMRQSGIHSRYVDTFNTNAASSRVQQASATSAPAQGFVPMAPFMGAAPKAPAQFFMPTPIPQHSRESSAESYSSQSQSQSNDFYGYNVAQELISEPMSSRHGALPAPPDVDPSMLLARPPVVHSTSAPTSYHSNQAANFAEELTELRLN